MASSRTEALGARLLDSLRAHPGSATAWVAFSGGRDSTAVLAALHTVRERARRPLAAVHVDHQWHPRSADWAEHCAAVCASLGVPYRCLQAHVDPGQAGGPEAALREARYAALAELLAPGELLITAHHREDQAGTVLLNALRASGSRGLAGMPASRPLGRGLLVRPALGEDRAELLACARECGLDWLEDPGNSDMTLDRNFIHHQVLPLLAARWPGAVASLAHSAARAREDAELLDVFAATLLEGRCSDAGELATDPAWAAHAGLTGLVIRHWLRCRCVPSPPGRRLDEFCRQLADARGDASAHIDWDGHRLRHWQGRLWLSAGELPPCPDARWDGRDPLALGPALGRLELSGGGMLPWPVRIGPRRGGERLSAAGGHRRKVKELLRTAGVPPWLRHSVPLLFHGDHPVAVGDWALAPELDHALRAQACELCWIPDHPALRGLRAGALARTRPG